MSRKSASFRVGKVRADLRGRTWYLTYYENGQRRRPRVGPDREAARQLAAQINAQLAVGAPAALSFEPIALPQLRTRWLDHHEQVLRSSVRTIDRYRTATDHLLRFLEQRPVRLASNFRTVDAEAFVRYLRVAKVSPNGHANTARRPLMDQGTPVAAVAGLAVEWPLQWGRAHTHQAQSWRDPLQSLQNLPMVRAGIPARRFKNITTAATVSK